MHPSILRVHLKINTFILRVHLKIKTIILRVHLKIKNTYIMMLMRCFGVCLFFGLFFVIFIAPACSRVRYRRPIFCPSTRSSVRLSTFMLKFDFYVKVSILINYKTKQPSKLAWNISLTSWLCNIGVRFSVCLSICPSVCQHLCRSSTFMSKLVF